MTDAFVETDNANRLTNLIRPAVITEVDLIAQPATARVEFEDGWVSDHLPVFQLSAGRVRSWSAPMVDEQVIALSPSGDLGAGWLLRGMPYAAFSAPSAEALMTILAEWEDGASDAYDEAAKARTITVPDGGAFHLIVGGLSIRVVDGAVSIDAAGGDITLTGGTILLNGDVRLGGTDGQAVARVGDNVVNGKITTGSGKATAA